MKINEEYDRYCDNCIYDEEAELCHECYEDFSEFKPKEENK